MDKGGMVNIRAVAQKHPFIKQYIKLNHLDFLGISET